jgi:glycosyltransferase involved in cell wall biosynthesis
MSKPRVSIGLPVYNGERYLSVAVDSVLRQDYEDFELIISDNASTDRTAEICREYASSDRRIRYYRNDVNVGAIPNFNRVFALARGPLFKWLTYDDVCCQGLLRRCVEVWNEAPDTVTLVFPRCELINENGVVMGELVEEVETRARWAWQRLRTVLLRRTTAQALCGLIRSDHLRLTRMRGSFAKDDVALLTELSMVGEFWEIGDILLQVRGHPGNAVKQHPTVRSHAVWLNPENKNKRLVLSPRTQLFVEALRSVAKVKIAPVQKILCYPVALEAYCERWLRDVTRPWRQRWFGNSVSARRQRTQAAAPTNRS